MNLKLKEPQVVYNAKGKRTHILLPYDKYEEMLEQLEDASDLLAMKEREHEETIPWEVVEKELKKKRR